MAFYILKTGRGREKKILRQKGRVHRYGLIRRQVRGKRETEERRTIRFGEATAKV